ncbi:hypothetical protein C5E51_24795 [Nocardia nova]|nr:hypothetical protein C5E51_24795 [Nocardia nova]
MAIGTVKFFRPAKGWGAIAAAELPDGCDAWVHFSAIEGEGFRELAAGDRVEFDYESAQQDSFRYRPHGCGASTWTVTAGQRRVSRGSDPASRSAVGRWRRRRGPSAGSVRGRPGSGRRVAGASRPCRASGSAG